MATVSKGKESPLTWLNDELTEPGGKKFFHEAYEATLLDTYGKDYEEELVVEPAAKQVQQIKY